MRLLIKPLIKKISWAIFFAVVLTSCTKQETQFFIFKRYDSEKDNWNYYKTDLYAPSRIAEVKILPCFSEDKRVQPVWSPNGKFYGCSAVYNQPLVIYEVNNEIIAKLEQGNPKAPLMWGIWGWSPNSQYVSIMNGGSEEKPYHDFSIMKFDGTEIHQFYKNPAAALYSGEWSPNGKYIVLEVTPYKDSRSVLIIFDTSGKEVAQFELAKFIDTPIVIAEQIKWSPDSKKLAFLTYYNMDVDSKLYVLDIESGKATDIIPDESICIMNISDWSPDSRKILFDAIDCEKHISGDLFDKVYYSINADDSELKPLTEKGFGSLNWTLDGKSIIVSGYGTDISDKGMYIMDADGSNKRILLDNGYFVSWITP